MKSRYEQFKPFQFRWAEKMGDKDNPYLIRWTFIFFGYSIRLHHWVGPDNKLHFHNHPWDFLSIILRGKYTNVTPKGRFEAKAPFFWKSKAEDLHYLDVPPTGAWTILLCGRPRIKWGFLVNGHIWRPLRYFHKFRNNTHAYNTQADADSGVTETPAEKIA
jgi:hypothetical protein